MARKLVQALLLFVVVGLFTGISFATQITLADSTGKVTFTGTNTGADVTFGTLSGNGLYGNTLGTYSISMAGGPPSLSPFIGDIYDVNMGGTVINFEFDLGAGGSLGILKGKLSLDLMTGASTRAPEFIGDLTITSSTLAFVGAYPVGAVVPADFTINLGKGNTTVQQVFQVNGKTTSGPVSSGEIPGVPEPSTLGLLGTGLLTMAGLLKRRVL